MRPKVRGINGIDFIDIPPNALLDDGDQIEEKKEQNDTKFIPSSKILKEVVIPEYITVHLGSHHLMHKMLLFLLLIILKM